MSRNEQWRRKAETENLELHEILKCDKSWPVCLFDFTYKNKVPDYFVFRVDKNSYEIKDNYFYSKVNSDNRL